MRESNPVRANFIRQLFNYESHPGKEDMEKNGEVVAGGGLMIVGYPSGPHTPTNRKAFILNVYTEPAHRRRGYAKAIVEAIIAWCREEGFPSVSLHASDAGRHIYETLGFKPTNEMRLVLK